MAFSKLLRTHEDEAEERAEQKKVIEEQMLPVLDALNKVYYTPAWEAVEAMLLEEQRQAFVDIMHAEEDQIVLARERAKLVARLLKRKEDLETELSRLREERNALEE